MSRVLYLVVCAAAPAPYVGTLVELARGADWEVRAILTPSARNFVDMSDLELLSGNPVRDAYSRPDEDLWMPKADAVIVAPATMNTLCKWATGICDNLVTGILGEAFGFGVPLVALPFVSDAQSCNPAYLRATRQLSEAGVRFPCGVKRPSRVRDFPWAAALEKINDA